jgi:hypothetical protein
MENITTATSKAADGGDPVLRAAGHIEEGREEGALWRSYLMSVLSRPISREEVANEIQTAA